MVSSKVITTVPQALKGKTPEELTAKMLANNLEAGIGYTYHHIQYDGKNWVAWYLKDASDLIRSRVNGVTQDN